MIHPIKQLIRTRRLKVFNRGCKAVFIRLKPLDPHNYNLRWRIPNFITLTIRLLLALGSNSATCAQTWPVAWADLEQLEVHPKQPASKAIPGFCLPLPRPLSLPNE